MLLIMMLFSQQVEELGFLGLNLLKENMQFVTHEEFNLLMSQLFDISNKIKDVLAYQILKKRSSQIEVRS